MSIAFADKICSDEESKKDLPKVSERMKALEILGDYLGIFKKPEEDKKPPELTVVYDYRGAIE